MKSFSVLVLLAGACARQVATPVDKVISLLTKLSKQVQAEGVAEAASYDKYACFCKESADNKVYAIAKSDKKIDALDADIKELEGEIATLDDDVATNKKEVEKEEKTLAENKKARETEQGTYAEKRKSLEEAIEAVATAAESMRNSRDDVSKEVASLVQKLPKTAALALIAGATAGKRYTQPTGKATSYEYSSNDVIATLASLTKMFKKELAELDTAEISARGDAAMAAGARANTIAALEKETNEKETSSASKGEQKADKEQQKTEETDARNADQGFLDDLTTKCEAKAEAWDKRSTTRASELTALTQAVELLKGMGGLYNTNTKLVGLVSKKSTSAIAQHAPVFFQLRSARRATLDEKKLEQLTTHLEKEAHSLKSAPLAMLALQLQAAGPDHFVKVRGIIKDLIAKLEADAKSEATSKTLCDKNMKAAVEKRDKHAAAVEIAQAEVASTTADINNLKKEIADLAQEVADHNKEMLEATELRAGEKADNEKAIANADAGKAAVDQAVVLLQKFYEGSFVQTVEAPKKDRDGTSMSDAPETFSGEYKGKVDSSKGIIGMLDVIASDFERTSKSVTDAEASAVKDFDDFKADNEKSTTDKEKLKATKETEVETKKSDLTGFKGDLKDGTKMNEEAIEELEKLQASCVDTGESFAERAAHRKEEIEALKQAMQILEDWK